MWWRAVKQEQNATQSFILTAIARKTMRKSEVMNARTYFLNQQNEAFS